MVSISYPRHWNLFRQGCDDDDDLGDDNDDDDDGDDNDSDNDSDNDDEQTHGIASFRRKLASLFIVASRTLFYSIAPG